MDTLERFVLVASGDQMAGNLALSPEVDFNILLAKPNVQDSLLV